MSPTCAVQYVQSVHDIMACTQIRLSEDIILWEATIATARLNAITNAMVLYIKTNDRKHVQFCTFVYVREQELCGIQKESECMRSLFLIRFISKTRHKYDAKRDSLNLMI